MLELMKLASEVTEKELLRPAENMDMVWATVGTGLAVVFSILIILVLILTLMGKIMGGTSKKKKNEPAPVAVVIPVASSNDEATAEDDYSNDEELIAVISAAVAAYGEAEGKQYRVIGVRKKEKALRSGWSSAGIADNTRPF